MSSMPTPFPPIGHHGASPPYPALYLYPLNDSFVPKQISLAPSAGRVKIGRQTNAKTVPGERNGYFDSKVLSRQHAEVWEEGGKIFIKDVKSSNGTFINAERLSPEGVESEPFELKTGDKVEFGIDIVGEDNKSIIHHKVEARIACVLGPEDLASLPLHHPPHPPPGAFTSARRPSIQGSMPPQPPSPAGTLGGMGGASLGSRSKSGLTFDHIIGRLQSELIKSREVGAELNGLTSAMNDIQDTLGGNVPAQLPPYPHSLPPVRPLDPGTSAQAAQNRPSNTPDSLITSLQSQIREAQTNLASNTERVRSMENILKEHEELKREVQAMRLLMQERKREVDDMIGSVRPGASHKAGPEDDDDEDDRRSVITVVPERENEEESDEERRERREELGRPRTPEPTGHGLDDDEDRSGLHDPEMLHPNLASTSHPNGSASVAADLHSQHAALASRLDALSNQLDSALALSKAFSSQAASAQATIEMLESKVTALEQFVQEAKERQQEEQARAEEQANQDSQATESVWEQWRKKVEGEWRSERESWESERERLKTAVKEWESRMEQVELKQAEMLTFQTHQNGINGKAMNGHGDHGVKRFSRKTRRKRSQSPPRSRSPSPPSPTLVSSSTSDEEGSTANTSISSSYMNGKPPGALPISPLQSADESGQTEQVANPADEDLNCIPNGHLGALLGSASGDVVKRQPMLAEHPLSYLSAAGVVVIGIAAWTVVNRVKD